MLHAQTTVLPICKSYFKILSEYIAKSVRNILFFMINIRLSVTGVHWFLLSVSGRFIEKLTES